MANRKVKAAAEGMPKFAQDHPGLKNFPTDVDQLGTNYLRTDTAPAAASETPGKPDLGDLESAIYDARMAAELAEYVATHATGKANASDGPGGMVVNTGWERELVIFAAMQAKTAAGAAMEVFDAFVGAGK